MIQFWIVWSEVFRRTKLTLVSGCLKTRTSIFYASQNAALRNSIASVTPVPHRSGLFIYCSSFSTREKVSEMERYHGINVSRSEA